MLCLAQISNMFEHIIRNIFLAISINILLGCSKEPSHRGPTTYVLAEK